MKHLLAVLLAVCAFGSIAQAQFMLGIDDQGKTYLINSVTGTGSFNSSTGLSNVTAMALRRDTKVYVASNSGAGTSSIYEIEFFSGNLTHLTTVPLGSIRALAFDFSSGAELFAVNDPLGTGGLDDLYRIDVALGSATLIGPIGFSGVEALAVGGGQFHAWDQGDGSGNGAGLITIDASTGAGTDVNPAVGTEGGVVSSLAHSLHQSLLYGGQDKLYQVNPTTGQLAFVGTGGYSNVQGMDFLSLDIFPFCTSKTSSLGCAPYVQVASGNVSKSGSPANPLVAGPVPGGANLPGILIFAESFLANPVPTSFGFLCIGQFQRAGAFPSAPGGESGFCNGVYSWNLAAIAATYSSIQPGDQLFIQGWYRDPGFAPPGNANFTSVAWVQIVP